MGPSRLLVSDIDGTLLGDDPALDRFAAWHALDGGAYRLVYATGRHFESLRLLIEATALPRPDASITAVGTDVRDRSGRRWPGWAERFETFDGDVVRRTLGAFRWLVPQSDEAQTPVKASFDSPGLTQPYLTEIRLALRRVGIDARLVYSSDSQLDVLPAAAGKGQATLFLAERWGARPEDVHVFGDSGNDLDLFGRGFRETVVANALPELRAGVADDAYRSTRPFADGVLDGIRHWTAERAGLSVPGSGRRRSGRARAAARRSPRTAS